MSAWQFRAFLDLMMCSDPWPVQGKTGEGGRLRLIEFADATARDFGYNDWTDAYNRLLKGLVQLAS